MCNAATQVCRQANLLHVDVNDTRRFQDVTTVTHHEHDGDGGWHGHHGVCEVRLCEHEAERCALHACNHRAHTSVRRSLCSECVYML